MFSTDTATIVPRLAYQSLGLTGFQLARPCRLRPIERIVPAGAKTPA